MIISYSDFLTYYLHNKFSMKGGKFMKVYRYDYSFESGITINEFDAEDQGKRLIIRQKNKINHIVEKNTFEVVSFIDGEPRMYSAFSDKKQMFIDQIVKKNQREMQKRKEEINMFMANSKMIIERVIAEGKKKSIIITETMRNKYADS